MHVIRVVPGGPGCHYRCPPSNWVSYQPSIGYPCRDDSEWGRTNSIVELSNDIWSSIFGDSWPAIWQNQPYSVMNQQSNCCMPNLIMCDTTIMVACAPPLRRSWCPLHTLYYRLDPIVKVVVIYRQGMVKLYHDQLGLDYITVCRMRLYHMTWEKRRMRTYQSCKQTYKHRKTYTQAHTHTHRNTDGWMHGWTDGWMDR